MTRLSRPRGSGSNQISTGSGIIVGGMNMGSIPGGFLALMLIVGCIMMLQQHDYYYAGGNTNHLSALLSIQVSDDRHPKDAQLHSQNKQQHEDDLSDAQISELLDGNNNGQTGGQSAGGQVLTLEDQRKRDLQFFNDPKRRKLGVFMGIFTADSPKDRAYRSRQRKMFRIWNDPRVCTLYELQNKPEEERYKCELVYTFILGANPDGPTAILPVEGESEPELESMVASQPYASVKGQDLNFPDVSGLAIKENMNEGKSQTFFYFGSRVAKKYGLDYVMKCDADAAIHLHEFFVFAYQNLISSSGLALNNVFAGALRDKAFWPKAHAGKPEEEARFESFFGNEYEGVHLYIAGQLYLMSTNLAAFVGEEASRSQCSYCEGHEDHDISSMALHSPEPVHMITITRKQRYWEHPVKSGPRWKRIIARETARMDAVPFEDKLLPKDSDFQAVMMRKDSLLLK